MNDFISNSSCVASSSILDYVPDPGNMHCSLFIVCPETSGHACSQEAHHNTSLKY
jgi:hypothetical protein